MLVLDNFESSFDYILWSVGGISVDVVGYIAAVILVKR